MADPPRVCVDTGIFVSVFAQPPDRVHRLSGSRWVLEAAERGEHQLVVPAHVIAETLGSPPMRPDAAGLREVRAARAEEVLAWVRDSRPLIVEIDQLLATQAARLAQAVNIKGGDALIVAAALQASCSMLYSWDDRDLTKLDGHPLVRGLRIINPVPVVPDQQEIDVADTEPSRHGQAHGSRDADEH